MEMHLVGLWIAKIVLEIYIFSAYNILIYCQDWEKIADKAHDRI